jgi:hypothetical protein
MRVMRDKYAVLMVGYGVERAGQEDHSAQFLTRTGENLARDQKNA